MVIRKDEEKTEEQAVKKPTTRAKRTTAKSSTTEKPKQTKTVTKREKVDLYKEVPVINMAQASLAYSARKGNGFLELEEYLDSDYMTVEDLQIMKNSNRGIFEKGWLYIDDEETVEFLGLKKYMDNILLPEQLEEIFEVDPTVLKEELSKFSASVKENIYQAMKRKYERGELSNVHTIKAIEESLNIDPSLSVLKD